MKPAPFDFVTPTSVEEALGILAEAGGGATVIAGGQTLMPLLNLRMSQPFILVDINRIPELNGISQTDTGVRIGPATRQRAVLESALLADHLPVFVEAVRHVGHHQTRNRGTVGGSIALGEPAAEQPAAAVALGAVVTLRSVRGMRTISAADFYLGPYMTAIEPDELLTAIDFPSWPAGHRTVFREVARRPGDFALTGIVGALAVIDGTIARAGFAWFGMGPTPVRARQAEAAVIGRSPDDLDIQELADLAIVDTTPFDDHHATAAYRRSVGARIFAQALGEALLLREVA